MLHKKGVTLVLILFGVLISGEVFAYSDVDSTYKYKEPIDYISSQGIVSGYPDGTFKPTNQINRAEFMKIIIGAKYGTDESVLNNYRNQSCFSDVPAFEWYTPYVCLGAAQGIVSGYPDGTFSPSSNINVVEALKIVINTFNYPVNENEVPWYRGYVDSASNSNLIPLDIISFDQLLNRGQMAELIARILKEKEGVLAEYLGDKADYRVTYDTIAQNINMENEYNMRKVEKNFCLNDECSSWEPDYVIITRPFFYESVFDFAEWKNDHGFTVGVFSVEYLDNMFSGKDLIWRMKNFIMDYTNNKNTKYFVLVGDAINSPDYTKTELIREESYNLDYEWNVPTGYYCVEWEYAMENDYSSCIAGTDLFYADFDEMGWNENADGYILRGNYSYDHYLKDDQLIRYERNDNPNSLIHEPRELDFETIIARIPVRDNNDFANVFNKLKSFQPTGIDLVADKTLTTDLNLEDKYNSECIASFLNWDSAAEVIYNCSDNHYIVGQLIRSFDTSYNEFIYDLSISGQQDAAKRKILENNRSMIVNFHGVLTANEAISDANVSDFENIFPLWIPNSCSTGAFFMGNQKALNEALITAEKGPAIIARPSNQYVFFKKISEGKTVGEAFYNVGESLITRYTANGDNLFGDPSLKVFGDSKF